MNTEKRIIAVGCDHGAFELKELLKEHLEKRGIAYLDFGTDSTKSVDYPVYADKVCRAIQEGRAELGILLCGTGIGMSIAANKHHGIRAACCSDTFSARLTRNHNDANVLCIGARVVGAGLAMDICDQFLDAAYEGGRHANRVAMVMELERSESEKE